MYSNSYIDWLAVTGAKGRSGVSHKRGSAPSASLTSKRTITAVPRRAKRGAVVTAESVGGSVSTAGDGTQRAISAAQRVPSGQTPSLQRTSPGPLMRKLGTQATRAIASPASGKRATKTV